jgi:hypothetical protein
MEPAGNIRTTAKKGKNGKKQAPSKSPKFTEMKFSEHEEEEDKQGPQFDKEELSQADIDLARQVLQEFRAKEETA